MLENVRSNAGFLFSFHKGFYRKLYLFDDVQNFPFWHDPVFLGGRDRPGTTKEEEEEASIYCLYSFLLLRLSLSFPSRHRYAIKLAPAGTQGDKKPMILHVKKYMK